LVYYFVANVAAYTQTGEHRRYPRTFQVLGAIACLVLVATLPWTSVAIGCVVFAAGVTYRLLHLRLAHR